MDTPLSERFIVEPLDYIPRIRRQLPEIEEARHIATALIVEIGDHINRGEFKQARSKLIDLERRIDTFESFADEAEVFIQKMNWNDKEMVKKYHTEYNKIYKKLAPEHVKQNQKEYQKRYKAVKYWQGKVVAADPLTLDECINRLSEKLSSLYKDEKKRERILKETLQKRQ